MIRGCAGRTRWGVLLMLGAGAGLFAGLPEMLSKPVFATASPAAEGDGEGWVEGSIEGGAEGDVYFEGEGLADPFIVSNSHPDPACWYFDTTFEAAWPAFAPEAPGFLWFVDQAPDTEPAPGTATFTAERQLVLPGLTQGTWWLHLAAADAAGAPLAESRAHFMFNVYAGPVEFSTNFATESSMAISDLDFAVDVHLYTGDWNQAVWQNLTPQNPASFWSPRYDHGAVVHAGAMWILGGKDSAAMFEYGGQSKNGLDWTKVGTDYHTSQFTRAIVYRDKIKTYESHPDWDDDATDYAAAAFQDRTWILGGFVSFDEVLCSYYFKSSDWEEEYDEGWWEGWDEGCEQFATQHTEGTINQVFSKRGNEATEFDYAPWLPRMYPVAFVFQDKLWVLGGYFRDWKVWKPEGSGDPPWMQYNEGEGDTEAPGEDLPGGWFLNDVWSMSGDGSWNRAAAGALWEARARHAALALDGKMWLFGGHRAEQKWGWGRPTASDESGVGTIWSLGQDEDFLNDIWTSSNGEDWELFEESAPWTGRFGHAALAFDGKIWILGGRTAEGSSNEIWCLGRPELHSSCLMGFRYMIDQKPDSVPTLDSTLAKGNRILARSSLPGRNWLHVAAEDTMGNLSAPAHYMLNMAYLAPIAISSSHPDPGKSYPFRDAEFFWSDPQQMSRAYYYVFDGESDTIPSAESPRTTARTLLFTNIAEGSHFLHLRGEDDEGHLSETAHFKINICFAAAPIIASPTHPDENIEYSSNDVTFTWEDPDGLAIGYYYDLTRQNQNGHVPATFTAEKSASFSDVGEGIWYLSVFSVDRYGNHSYLGSRRVMIVTEAALNYPPHAHFQIYPDSGNVPLTVRLENTSELFFLPVHVWSIDFGDGTVVDGSDPFRYQTHVYYDEGPFSVSLSITTAGGTAVETKANCVRATLLPPSADFSADSIYRYALANVHFRNTSNLHGLASLSWFMDFGDGNIQSGSGAMEGLDHVYEKSGHYTVSLSIVTAGGADTETKTAYMTIMASWPPVAAVSISDTSPSGGVPRRITVINDSALYGRPLSAWILNFGDGTVLTGSENWLSQEHVYEFSGYFTVSLTVTTDLGTDTDVKINCVHVLGDHYPSGLFSADVDKNNRIELSELLRTIQFFNSDGYRCAISPATSEDGFLPGAGTDHNCVPHTSDYNPADWRINLSELLRLIQFFNEGGYTYCPDQGTEDDFCSGYQDGGA